MAKARVKVHALLAEQADELGDGDDGVRVVELNGRVVGKGAEVAAVHGLIALEDVLERRGAEEVLLLEAQHLALVAVVVGVEDLGDVRPASLRSRSGPPGTSGR